MKGQLSTQHWQEKISWKRHQGENTKESYRHNIWTRFIVSFLIVFPFQSATAGEKFRTQLPITRLEIHNEQKVKQSQLENGSTRIFAFDMKVCTSIVLI